MHPSGSARTRVGALGIACLIASGVYAQQALPKPGPQQALFKMDEGSWDAVSEMFIPGAPSMKTNGVETNSIGCGGLCLITDFKGEMMGAPYHGHGTTTWDSIRKTWDSIRKKYTQSWTDSMSYGLSVGESVWDAGAKKMTGTLDSPDPATGKVFRMRSVLQHTPDGKRIFSLFGPGADGKEFEMMKITYTRKR